MRKPRTKTEISAWGCLMAGATVMIHAAGWLEGGLTLSYEKLVTDMEMVQVMAELCAETPAEDADIGLDALRDVQPGGHFFATQHTMDRYQTAFYEPKSWDRSNFGTWSERGEVDANIRATGIWKAILADHVPPPAAADADRIGALRDFIARRTAEGGAPPVS
jgi:trimethylamine--corrinoid protein Co-methyltransferase